MTGENMQRVILFQVVEFQGVIFTRLEYDQTVKSALTRASHIFMWKYPDSPGIQVQFLCSKAPPTHGFFHYVCLVCLSKNSRTIEKALKETKSEKRVKIRSHDKIKSYLCTICTYMSRTEVPIMRVFWSVW